jgi:diguanylate cyclase (GGDEF)-like protein
VEVRDVLTDPLWAPYRALIEPTGLRACWSTPILSTSGDVMATFALYYRTPRTASPFHRRMVEACVPLCRIALRHEEHRVEIERLVYVDPLTGLPNRRLLNDRASVALQFAARTTTRGALLLLDIDRFRTANDSLGHAVGDQLLHEVARRLRADTGPGDTVARLGGDEFAVLIPECQPMVAMHTAEALRHALATPVTIGDLSVSATASIGISVFPDDGLLYESVLKNAEVAMYEAKKAGGNAARFFTPRMNAVADERLRLESALRQAIARQALEVHYQPKFRLDGRGCTGCEALVRWTDPEFGRVAPDRFIPLAEESGLVNALDAWVLETACAQQAAWRARGVGIPSVSVNVSPVRFQQDDVPVHVGQVLARTGLPARALVLEITERTLLGDASRTRDDLRALHEMGVTLSVDDFGTGYSSLGYLKRLPVGELKIDRSFVRDLETEADDRALAAAVMGVARALGLTVVAEGVETAGQRDILVGMGCDAAQGFGYTPALPADALEAWLTGDGRRWTSDDNAGQ